jgi:hypothetical protein
MGHSVAEYQATLHEWWDAVLHTERCPHCHCLYQRHQIRARAAWEDCEHTGRLLVLRLRCPRCDRTQTVLPDFLAPYRRYRTAIREAVVAEETAAPPCDERTARRWVSAFRARITDAIGQLTAWVLTPLAVSRQDPAFLDGLPPCYATLRWLRVVAARQAPEEPPASGLLGWANQRLCRVGAGTL